MNDNKDYLLAKPKERDRPKRKGKRKIDIPVDSKFISHTGVDHLLRKDVDNIYPHLNTVLDDPKVIAYAEKFQIKVDLRTIYDVFRSYIKYSIVAIKNGATYFHFPNLGTLRQYGTDYDFDAVKDANIEANKLPEKDRLQARRNLCLKFYKQCTGKDVERIIKLKKRQWGLK